MNDLNNEFRQRLQSVGGITITSVASADETVSGGQKPIMISIKGPDLNELQKISDRFMVEMAKIDGIVDLETSLKESKPTLGVQINRVLASDLGLSVNQIANVVRPLIAGDDVTTWQDEKGETYDVNLRLTEDRRTLPSDLQNMYITSSKMDGNNQPILIPLSSVANFEEKLGASQINRRDLAREVLVEANTSGRPQVTSVRISADFRIVSTCRRVIVLIPKAPMQIWQNPQVMRSLRLPCQLYSFI